MARKTLTEGGYLLTPSTRTLVIQNKIVPQERLVLITNDRTNQVIYNFSDPSLRVTSYAFWNENQLTAQITGATGSGTAVTYTATNSFTPGQIVTISGIVPNSFNFTATVTAATPTTFTVASTVNGTYVSGGQVAARENTVMVLNYNTGSMLATDKLQIVIDEFNERTNPSEELTDPVGKQRISAPQALIDTDFEYSTQPSKWESITSTNLRPQFAPQLFNALPVTAIATGAAGTKTITITQATTTSATTATGVQGNGTFMYYTTAAAHNARPGQWVTVTGVTPSGYNTTSGIPALILAVPSSTTFVIAGSTTGQSTVAGTATFNVAPPVGAPIAVQDTYHLGANGQYVVATRASETSWTYVARGSTPTGWASQSIFDANKTVISTGSVYKDAAIIGASAFAIGAGNTINVTCSTPHGLAIGNEIAVVGTTAASNAPNGSYAVVAASSPTVFSYYADALPTGTISHNPLTTTATGAAGTQFLTCASVANVIPGMVITGAGIPSGTVVLTVQGTVVQLSQAVTAALSTTTVNFFAAIYARSQGQVLHRAFDGGVIFSNNAGSNNVSLARQTRRYFRYQSGKGLQISSGTILNPTISVDTLSYSAPLVTVTLKERHNLQPGYLVNISGANENGYNGTFTVVGVTGLNTFTYAPTSAPALANATGNITLAVTNWNGATARLGAFDSQNGIFFEYDGQQLYAVMRSATFQVTGRVTVTNNSSTVAQFNASTTPTLFNKQLIPGDFIVIRGQTYRIDTIASDSSMTITPPYRGATADNVIVSKIVDTRIPQSAWNIDKADGTGQSGFRLDLTKMQMFYIDYSWYGAGSIRWGFRGRKGEIIYCHKMQNNNLNSSAYMRSGNLPARYETVSQPATTIITSSVGGADTTINVQDTTGFYRPVTVTTTASGTNGLPTVVVASAASITVGMFANASNITAGTVVTAISGTTITLSANNTGAVSGAITFSSYPGNITLKSGTQTEVLTYTGLTSNTFTGVTRAGTGNTSIALTIAANSNVATVGSAANLQVGQRIISPSFAEGTKIEYIQGTTLVLSSSSTTANPTVAIPALSLTGIAPTFSATAPVVVEQSWPTFSPTISHWGTSVMMDGRYDDDKSLNFTYGQTVSTGLAPIGGTTATGTTSGSSVNVTLSASNTNIVPGMYVTDAGTAVPRGTYVVSVTSGTAIVLNNAVSLASTALTFSGAATKALLSIRVAPSIDNGIPAAFGSREVLNRAQLIMRAIDISLLSVNVGNVLVQLFLNGTPFNPTAATNLLWSNAIGGALFTPNSSFAQIADYSTLAATGSNVVLAGGEVTGGFLTNSTTSIDLSQVRDLGNSILGGGTAYVNSGIYPDGPDTLTVVVTNISTVAQSVLGRLTWTEAQA